MGMGNKLGGKFVSSILLLVLCLSFVNAGLYVETFDNCSGWLQASSTNGGGTLDCSSGTFKCGGNECLSGGIIYGNPNANISKDFLTLNMTIQWNAASGDFPGIGLFTSTPFGDTPQPWQTYNPDTGTANDNIWVYQIDGGTSLVNCQYPNNAKPTSGVHNITSYWVKVEGGYNITETLDNESCYAYALATLANGTGLFPALGQFRSTTGSLDNLRIEWSNQVESCNESWQPHYSLCDVSNEQTLTYADQNACGTIEDLPVDNGTVSACNYCTSAYNTSYGNCLTNSRSITYQYINSCCADTGLESDCNAPSNTTGPCQGAFVAGHEVSEVSYVVVDIFAEAGIVFLTFSGIIVTFMLIAWGYTNIRGGK